jgi:hypothetical protein
VRAAHGSVEHTTYDVIRLIDRSAFAVQNERIAFDAQRDRKSVLKCREILIELSEEAEVIAQGA